MPKHASDPLELGLESGQAELSCPHTSLRRASRQLTQLYDDALEPSGFTSAQATLVGQVDSLGGAPEGEGPPLHVLARRLGIQISALTHALRPLVRDGLLEVRADRDDRRTKRVVLTAQGYRQTQLMYQLWVQTNQRIENVLGAGVAEQLVALSERINAPDFVASVKQLPTE